MKIYISRPIYLGQGQGESHISVGEIQDLMHTSVDEVPWAHNYILLQALLKGPPPRGQGGVPKTSVVLCTLVVSSSVFSLMLNGLLQVIPLMSVRLFCNKMLSDKNMDIRIRPCLY